MLNFTTIQNVPAITHPRTYVTSLGTYQEIEPWAAEKIDRLKALLQKRYLCFYGNLGQVAILMPESEENNKIIEEKKEIVALLNELGLVKNLSIAIRQLPPLNSGDVISLESDEASFVKYGEPMQAVVFSNTHIAELLNRLFSKRNIDDFIRREFIFPLGIESSTYTREM
jgi:hypothetical protein